MLAFGVCVAAVTLSADGHAEPTPVDTTSSGPATEPTDAPGLEWKPTWRRHQWYDYAYTGTLAAGAVFELLLPVGNDPKRAGGILLDDAVRDAFVLQSNDNRSVAKTFADISLVASSAYPAVVDVGIVALGVHESPDVAWQMFLIDLQAFAFTSFVTGTVKRIVDRDRPVATECRRDPDYDDSCESAGNHLSFPSGHTSISFTGASLTCLHHAELELYGSAGDAVACVTTLTLATLTGTARIAADKHYLSDVVSGAVIGSLSGAFLPWLLYYRGGGAAEAPPGSEALGDSMVVPMASDTQLGAAWVGRF